MRSNSSIRNRLALLSVGFVCAMAAPSFAADVASLQEAKVLAAERNVPILLDFYTQW